MHTVAPLDIPLTHRNYNTVMTSVSFNNFSYVHENRFGK